MRPKRRRLSVLLLFALGACATSRGPVDRSVDAAHATNRTIGETADQATDGPRSALTSALTFPFRLIGRVGDALFGP